MDLLPLLFIAFSLSADCFAVALSGSFSMRTLSYPQVFRTSFAFGLFQFLMTVLGWLAGRTIVEVISAYDHWVVFTLLAFVGGRMIWETFHSRDGRTGDTDITKGILLLTLSIATSIDALAVGLSFAFLEVDIIMASSIIGTVAVVVTAVGFWLGRKVGGLLGKGARFVGGVVLIGIGLRILLTHVL